MKLNANKELAKYPSPGVVIRRCIARLADGSDCRAAAIKGSPRCRHHQLDFRLPERVTLGYIAADDRHRRFIAEHSLELLVLPFRKACERLRGWEELGIVTRSRSKQLRYALQMNAVARRMRDNERFRGSNKRIQRSS